MKFEYYVGKDGKWYWRLVARNGRTIADGAQGYGSKSKVLTAIRRVRYGVCPGLPVLRTIVR